MKCMKIMHLYDTYPHWRCNTEGCGVDQDSKECNHLFFLTHEQMVVVEERSKK